MRFFLTAAVAGLTLSACAPPARLEAPGTRSVRPGEPLATRAEAAAHRLVDPQATPETRALYANLFALQGTGDVLMGQQDATAYGVGWRPAADARAADVEPRSDFRQVAGDYPAVYGGNVAKVGIRPIGIDSVRFDLQRELLTRAYQRGGVVTYAWHADHPAGTEAWDTTHTVREVLPGGAYHAAYLERLDAVAAYLGSHRDGRTSIPLIFRPFHEHTGSWFWWGKKHCTPDEFVALWRMTVEYLRDTKGLHTLLYAYSPDLFGTREEYLERYPGDDYVDILGFDDYYDFYGDDRTPALFTDQMRVLTALAAETGKVAALTEVGPEYAKKPETAATFWSDTFLPALRADAASSRIAYMLTWRNRDAEHYYASYPGAPSAASFQAFTEAPGILTEREAPAMYRLR